MAILAGDIGGTKTVLALFEVGGDLTRPWVEARYKSNAYPSLEAIVVRFCEEHVRGQRIEAAAFGVAGPVHDGRCSATNLVWVMEESSLGRALNSIPVRLLNDLAATAYGILHLPQSDLLTVSGGRPQPQAPLAVIAAGTGLGEASLVWDAAGQRYLALPSEGGHADFAPRTELQVELWRSLNRHLGRVSYEHVLSGPGKVRLYEFLRDQDPAQESAWLRTALRDGDASPLITEYGLSGKSALCRRALELFVAIYGAEAGNWALKTLARGGVYLGGGIAPTLVDLIKSDIFLEPFYSKGPVGELLRDFPIHVVLNDKAALYGAAFVARQLLAGSVS
jgi:glucokinase